MTVTTRDAVPMGGEDDEPPVWIITHGPAPLQPLAMSVVWRFGNTPEDTARLAAFLAHGRRMERPDAVVVTVTVLKACARMLRGDWGGDAGQVAG